MNTPSHIAVYRALICFGALSLVTSLLAIAKPIGTFSSSGAAGAGIYANPNLRGVLIRANWSALEPSPGVFDFSSLTTSINTVQSHGLPWSLAIAGGGPGSPAWLIDTLGAPYITYTFRGVPGYRLPLFWHSTVQDRLQQLANALAAQYNGNASLQLVYVTQMTANGVEGHLQGVNMTDMVNAGYTDALWIEAGKQAARSYANSFTNKAVAFEVHEVNGGSTVPATIINDLWNDPALGQRVGAAMWWISGKTTYQPALIDVLTAFPGDIYGQVIGRSDDVARFANNDYTTVFTQAKTIGLRYIEPWEYEFKYGAGTANGAWDATFADFNAWADATFGPDVTPPAAPSGLTATAGDAQVTLDWADNTETDLAGYTVFRATNSGGPYTELPGALLTTSDYTDATAVNGTTYYYVVTAADTSANESDNSNEASATPQVPGPVTLLSDGFETSFANWDGNGATDWDRTMAQLHAGSYSTHAGSSDNDLISDNLDTSSYNSITISFWYRDDDIDSGEALLQLFDGAVYVTRSDLNLATEDTWTFYTTTLNRSTDPQYFRTNFRLKFEATSLDSGENLWIDDVTVTAQ